MGILSKLISQLSGEKSEGAKASLADQSENLLILEQSLTDLPEKETQFFAAFALLLGRLAYADGEISDQERSRMEKILGQHAHLDEAKAHALTNLSVDRTLVNTVENHLIVRQMRTLTEKAQREEVVRALFALASEEDISQAENRDIRIIAEGLGFTHQEFVHLRSEYREHLPFLRKLPDEN